MVKNQEGRWNKNNFFDEDIDKIKEFLAKEV